MQHAWGSYKCVQKVVTEPESKRPLRRPRLMWEVNIKIYLKEMDLKDVNWVYLAPDINRWRLLVNAVMELQLP
jgi:hypothetical protein